VPAASSIGAPNPWLSIDYVTRAWPRLLDALIEHVFITVAAVGVACIVAIPLAVIALRLRWLTTPFLAGASLLYTIPSLALITGLWPIFGLSTTTVIVALAVYALLIVLRNAIVGMQQVPEHVVSAARSMGYPDIRVITAVRLPIAIPAVMAGIRVATVSTVGLVMIGALVGHGGLGSVVLDGFTNNFYRAPIVTGIVLTVVLALLLEFVLVRIEKRLTPWSVPS